MRTWQLERTRVGFLFDARALFASVQEEGEGKLYIKKREIPIRIVHLTRNEQNRPLHYHRTLVTSKPTGAGTL